jgi:type IV pilus assembly protein PilW
MKKVSTLQTIFGFTIIEMMVSLLLGIMVSLAVVQLYMTNSQTYLANQDLARLQENGRYALYRLSTELRMTGYMGCIKSDPSKVTTMTTGPNTVSSNNTIANQLKNNFEQPIQGEEASGYNSSDEITLSHGVSDSVFSVSAVSGTTYTATGISTLISPAPNNILMISDCEKAIVFVPNSSGVNTITANSITGTFQPGAEIMKATSTRFFIANVSGVPTLAQQVNGGAEEDLVDNIESMQILYGEDTDSAADEIANSYRRASQITDWGRVVAVRITLTLVTPAHGTAPVTRQTMDMTIDVRNRL